MNILEGLKNRKDLEEVFAPENYVFDEKGLRREFLQIPTRKGKPKTTTKTQLRNFFNVMKSVHNSLRSNPAMSKEEFETKLKEIMVMYPVVRSKNTFSFKLLDVIKETLTIIFKTAQNDLKKAKEDFERFVRFYETLIAYSRDK